MLAVIEALICFDTTREQIDVLSLGCGDDRYVVSQSQIVKGGLWHWKADHGRRNAPPVTCCDQSSPLVARAAGRSAL